MAGGGDERSAAAVPSEYLGQQARWRRVEMLRDANRQVRTFRRPSSRDNLEVKF